MRTVAIVGTGLIGGSFGLALRAAGFSGEILGVSSAPAIEGALRVGAIDRGASFADATGAADLLFLAQPVRRIIGTLAHLGDCVRPDALITDAGSTKVDIVGAAAQHITKCRFIGGHPMAGSEKSGAEAADANLFRGRPWVLTPTSAADLRAPAAAELVRLIERFGAEVIVMDAAAHDRTVAATSHLPQLASTALAACLAAAGESIPAAVCGPGLLDMTRLAQSSFEVWNDILATNGTSVQSALERYIVTLTFLREVLGRGDEPAIRQIFEQAQQLAARIRAPQEG